MAKKSLMETLKAYFSDEADVEPVQKPEERRANVWGMSGRSAQMQSRTMMQLKAFERQK